MIFLISVYVRDFKEHKLESHVSVISTVIVPGIEFMSLLLKLSTFSVKNSINLLATTCSLPDKELYVMCHATSLQPSGKVITNCRKLIGPYSNPVWLFQEVYDS